MVQVICEIGTDHNPASIGKYGVDIVPLDVLIGKINYKDSVISSTTQLFDLVNTNGLPPKNSAPSISSKLPSTHQSAL